MTRNKQQVLRLSKVTRTSLALALSLSMVLGLVPNGALKAMAEEAEVQDVVVVDDMEAGSGAAELQGDAVAIEDAAADEGAAEDEAVPEDGATEGQDEDEASVEDQDEATAEGEVVAKAEEAAELTDTILEAEADGMRASLLVKAGVELPEGSRLVVTSLADAVEQAAAEAEAATEVEPQEQGTSVAALAGAVAGLGADAAEQKVVTGADVALTGMSDAVDTCVAEQLAEEEGEAEEAEGAEDAAPETQVTAAYAIEVVDGEDNLVPLSEDNAMMTVTLSKEVADEADGVYAVTRSEAEPEDEPQVTEAKGTPVATVAEEEYKDEKAAAEAVVYAGEAEDVTSDVKVDEETGEAEVVIVGAPSVIVTKNKPKKVQAAPGLTGANPNPVAMGKNSTDGSGTADTNSLGFVINLFDYDVPDTLDPNGDPRMPNTYNNDPQVRPIKGWNYGQPIYGDPVANTNTNKGINADKDKDKDLKFYASGDGKTTSQWRYEAGSNPGNTINEFTGVGHRNDASNGTNFYTLQYANQGIVKSTLSGSGTDYANRYPVVNTPGGSDTAYLFDTNNIEGAKTVYKNVNNLLYYENYGQPNEKLVYDSNYHYAYYDTSQSNATDGGDFTVYTDTYDRAGGSKSGMRVGFFPFNNYAAPGETPCINPNESDWANEVNHHLGLSMRVPLTMPKDGLIRMQDGLKVPMEFEFSGDDDMWVFIDGKLVLDIGGIHQPVKGTINFETGEVKLGQGTVNPPQDDRATDNNVPDAQKTVDQKGHYSYPASGIVDDTNVLGDTAWLWTKDGHTGILGSQDEATGQEHVLQVFYLERGGCDSNLKITSNIHLMTEKSVEVEKEWKGVDDAFKKPVTVRLIRKETNIDDSSDVKFVALGTYGSQNQAGTQELNSSNDWDYKWVHLPSEGWREGSSNPRIYCDYSYYVEEVLPDGATFGPLYRNGDTQLTTEEITYQLGNSSVTADAVKVIEASTDNSPVTITNVPTTIEVEKQWNDKNNQNETGNAIHDKDSVWVQLYKQTYDSDTDTWSDAEPVYTGDNIAKGVAKLKKDNNPSWKATFQISETGDNVRYLVKEGTYDAASKTFTASDTMTAGDNKEYERVSTTYTPRSVSYVANDANHNVTWTDGTSSTEGLVVPDSGSGKALIINKPVVTADLVLKKTDASDQSALAGAKFKIYKDGGSDGPDGAFVKADDIKDEQLFSNETYETAGAQGSVTISELKVGTYWIVETSAPQGYLVAHDEDHPIGVTVAADGTVSVVEASIENDDTGIKPTFAPASGSTPATLTVPNARTYTLPAAGGLGVYPFLLAGSFIAALAFDRSGEFRRKLARLLRQGARA